MSRNLFFPKGQREFDPQENYVKIVWALLFSLAEIDTSLSVPTSG